MIVDAFFGLIFGLLSFVLGLLPSWTDPSFVGSLPDLGDRFGGAIHNLDPWVDTALAANILAAMLLVMVAVYGAKLVLWLYSLIPGKAA